MYLNISKLQHSYTSLQGILFTIIVPPYSSFIKCLDQWHLWQANNPNSTECFIRINIWCKNSTLSFHKCFCHLSKQCIVILLFPRTPNICVCVCSCPITYTVALLYFLNARALNVPLRVQYTDFFL